MGINLGRRIRQVREFLGMSQLEFGTAIGIHTQAAISRYERGLREPEAEVLERIAALVGKPVAWLLEGAAAAENDDMAEFQALCRQAAGLDVHQVSELVRQAQGDRAAIAFVQLQAILAGLLGINLTEASHRLADMGPELTSHDLYAAYGNLLAEGQYGAVSNHLTLLRELRRTHVEVAHIRHLIEKLMKGDQ